ncbi:hypothetical protein Rsub_05332 [Raphidocelis subcapitata]|uniref:Uncharacterized protein n=1 Tax=Raphidocelis subcapitata TaxID=307507 RepID=A0A2V0NY37_9CHLO|nr:hypothetical protein Rsub_05332 [Raphidocelis subcapitata]|eukprot:GBF92249.1 hypothetical protein Rsub_05332 [Raphidocelis subcapitata]
MARHALLAAFAACLLLAALPARAQDISYEDGVSEDGPSEGYFLPWLPEVNEDPSAKLYYASAPPADVADPQGQEPPQELLESGRIFLSPEGPTMHHMGVPTTATGGGAGVCADGSKMVNCFADPCRGVACGAGETCASNYCGGCNFKCAASPLPLPAGNSGALPPGAVRKDAGPAITPRVDAPNGAFVAAFARLTGKASALGGAAKDGTRNAAAAAAAAAKNATAAAAAAAKEAAGLAGALAPAHAGANATAAPAANVTCAAGQAYSLRAKGCVRTAGVLGALRRVPCPFAKCPWNA